MSTLDEVCTGALVVDGSKNIKTLSFQLGGGDKVTGWGNWASATAEQRIVSTAITTTSPYAMVQKFKTQILYQ